jgi:pyruvate/2-oxoacid:ferredoxin oxidoreductase beta subunit
MSFISKGHIACQGCAALSTANLILNELGPKTVAVIPACCLSVCNGPYPSAAFKIPVVNCAFETAAITAAGIRAGLDVKGEEANVLVLAGDGGTYDIGLQALSGAAERNDDILYVCYDNEAYMNTGIQRSSSTPYGAHTMTTPGEGYKREYKKDIIGILKAHDVPYIATTTIAKPGDFKKKIRKAKDMKGFRFILAFTPCPTGWKFDPKYSIKMAKLAVKSGLFPLREIIWGEETVKKVNVLKSKDAFKEYIKLQGRFKHLSDEEINNFYKAYMEFDWKF